MFVVVVKAQSSAVDKVKHRLEQLDDVEDGSVRQMLDLTQQEYMNRIEQLNLELVQVSYYVALEFATSDLCAVIILHNLCDNFYFTKIFFISGLAQWPKSQITKNSHPMC